MAAVEALLPEGRLSPGDPNSFSRPEVAKVVDVDLKLEVDFEKKVLRGNVTLTVERVRPDATRLVLDSWHLDVERAVDAATGTNLGFSIGPEGYVGSKLDVELPPGPKPKVMLIYSTTDKCSALQWLDPAQTAGKSHPYMFSQCQAIHCRSMVPCQDTPSVKATYTAEITAPGDLVVVMSAVGQGEPEKRDDSNGGGVRRVFRFRQAVPVQSYLIAIAVGKLESRVIGPRSKVWSEKELVDEAASEFSETETMLKTAEDLCGSYVWGVYDVLVLPPSFPYGGMENPCLTFATPTLLAGDRSLSNVIAHEIAHSWSGNLVTNVNFEHFWLNEGFTVFIERKIAGRMSRSGEATRHFQAIGGWKELKNAVELLGKDNPLTRLVVNLNGVDPDDAFSTVPYEKGSTLLWHLEELVGGPAKFEPFLKLYFDHFKFQSIDSYQFKDFFLAHFEGSQNLSSIDWESLYDAPGLPVMPKFDTSLSEACANLKKKWVEWSVSQSHFFTKEEFMQLSAGQKVEFLSQLLEDKEPLGVRKLEVMDEVYGVCGIKNAEIKFRWIQLGLRSRWETAVEAALQMVTEQGRMKFVRPLYRELYAWEEKRALAVKTFLDNRVSMMQVAIRAVEKDLHLKSS